MRRGATQSHQKRLSRMPQRMDRVRQEQCCRRDRTPPVAALRSPRQQKDQIDGFDFLFWQRGYGTPAPLAVKQDGDADNDLDVDVDDLHVWEASFGVLIVPSQTNPAMDSLPASSATGPTRDDNPTAVGEAAGRTVSADRAIGERDRADSINPAAAGIFAARRTVSADGAVRERDRATRKNPAAGGIIAHRTVSTNSTLGKRDYAKGINSTAIGTAAGRTVSTDRAAGECDIAGGIDPTAVGEVARRAVATDHTLHERDVAS
jgi:hypothetical protein